MPSSNLIAIDLFVSRHGPVIFPSLSLGCIIDVPTLPIQSRTGLPLLIDEPPAMAIDMANLLLVARALSERAMVEHLKPAQSTLRLKGQWVMPAILTQPEVKGIQRA